MNANPNEDFITPSPNEDFNPSEDFVNASEVDSSTQEQELNNVQNDILEIFAHIDSE